MFTQVCQAVVLLILLWVSSADTATFYVATNGDDDNPCADGNIGAPKLHLKNGSDCLQSAGDTLVVRGGTYLNQCLGDFGTEQFGNIPNGTSWSNPTTIRAHVVNGVPEVVTMRQEQRCNPGPNATGAITFLNSQFVVIDGINVNGVVGDNKLIEVSIPSKVWYKNLTLEHGGDLIGGGTHDSIFENITLKYGGWNESFVADDECDPQVGPGKHGIYFFTGNNNTFRNITSFGHCGLGMQLTCDSDPSCVQPTGNLVERSKFYDNRSWGLILRPGNIIKNTLVYNNYAGIGSSPHIYNTTVIDNNNTNMGNDVASVGIANDSGSGQIIKNTISIGHNPDIGTATTGPTMSNNLCGSNDASRGCTASTIPANFVDHSARDYRLKAGAPAIDAGVNVPEITNDYTGATRTGQNDIGAYEFTSVTAGPATKLLFQTQPPASIDAGEVMTGVTVRVADVNDITVTSSTATITLAVTGGCGSTMSGYTPQQVSGGVTTFSTLSFAPAGSNCTLQAQSSPLASATSNPFTVTTPPVLPPTYLSNFDDPAPSTEVGQVMAIPFVVALFNENNQVVTTSSAPITLSLHPNSPPGATLNCGPSTCTQNASSGQVSFNQVSLTGVTVTTSGYTFRYASPGLPNGQSGSFTITVGPVGRLTPPIKVDQFGYLPTATKVAVLSDPQTGFNAADAYTPGALTVKTSPGGTVVFSGSATAWNAGATHAQSGDKLWWFDFSSVTAPGAYIIEDATNTVQSDVFVISASVYNAVLTTALKMFYYQRSGFAKVAPYADAKWADGAAFLGTNQDTQARNAADKTNAATARDVQGGWFDAGDYNKYTSNAVAPIHDLLTAYLQAPTLWTDDTNIPERLNGIPDILDEVKWELDWLLRMQTATGNGSVLSKVSVDAHQNFSPPSTDATARYWGATSTGATAVAAGAFAHGAIAFALAGQSAYATTLTNAAIAAYDWATANPNVTYANTGFLSGNPEPCTGMCLPQRVRAAIYLYGRTGTASYKTFVEAQYTNVPPMNGGWTPFGRLMQDAMLYYASLAGATGSVKTAIQNSAISAVTNGVDFVPPWTANTDGYRAYLHDVNYTWGSNSTKAAAAVMYTNMLAYGLDTANHTLYRRIAESYAHYLHGVNPLGIVYLSAMGAAFAERSVNELYHAWFKEGTDWQNALTSLKGPAPGYVPGGPNPGYTGNQTPPSGQPIQKAYRDWGSFDPAQEAWSISEPSIMYQGVYVRLLAPLVPIPTGVPTQLAFFPQPAAQTVTGVTMASVSVRVLDTNGQLVNGSTLPITITLATNPSGGTLNCGAETCTKPASGGIAPFNTLSIGTGGVTAVGPGYSLGASTTGGVTSATSNTFSIIPVPTEPDPPTDLVISTFSTGQFIAR